MDLSIVKVPQKRDKMVGFRTTLDNKRYLNALCKANDTTVSILMDSIVEQLRLGELHVSNKRKSS